MKTEDAKRILKTFATGQELPHKDEDVVEAVRVALDCMEEGMVGRVTHELKLSLNFCDAVYNGLKTFELRKNDRGFQTGDLIRFTPVKFDETEPSNRFPDHPIRNVLYEIIYILNGWGLTADCVALGIRELKR